MKHNGRIIRSAQCVTVISASRGKHFQRVQHDTSVYFTWLAPLKISWSHLKFIVKRNIQIDSLISQACGAFYTFKQFFCLFYYNLLFQGSSYIPLFTSYCIHLCRAPPCGHKWYILLSQTYKRRCRTSKISIKVYLQKQQRIKIKVQYILKTFLYKTISQKLPWNIFSYFSWILIIWHTQTHVSVKLSTVETVFPVEARRVLEGILTIVQSETDRYQLLYPRDAAPHQRMQQERQRREELQAHAGPRLRCYSVVSRTISCTHEAASLQRPLFPSSRITHRCLCGLWHRTRLPSFTVFLNIQWERRRLINNIISVCKCFLLALV